MSRARQIPEWEEYDSEIARFARKLADEGTIRSDAIAGDVNYLANVGKGASGGNELAPEAGGDAEDIRRVADGEEAGGKGGQEDNVPIRDEL